MEHEDYLAVPDTIGVNRSTAKGITARYLREGRIVVEKIMLALMKKQKNV